MEEGVRKEKMISVEEGASLLGVSEIHFRKLLEDGSIPYINVAHGKIRKSIRVDREAIEKFIASGGVSN